MAGPPALSKSHFLLDNGADLGYSRKLLTEATSVIGGKRTRRVRWALRGRADKVHQRHWDLMALC